MSETLSERYVKDFLRKDYLSLWFWRGPPEEPLPLKDSIMLYSRFFTGFVSGVLGIAFILSFFGFEVYRELFTNPSLEMVLLAIFISFLGFGWWLVILAFNLISVKTLDKRGSLSTLYEIHNVVRYIYSILLFSIVIMFLIDFFELTSFVYLKLYLGILILTLPYFTYLSPVLSKKGQIKLEFDLLNQNFEDFPEQQKWLTRLFKRVESALRTGYIDVSHSALSYRFNIAQREPEKVAGDLESVKNALINEQYGTELISNLETLCPKIEFTSFQRRAIIHRIHEIFTTYQKYFAGLVLILTFILNPMTTLEYLEQLFSFLK